jgi:hypothetical protein
MVATKALGFVVFFISLVMALNPDTNKENFGMAMLFMVLGVLLFVSALLPPSKRNDDEN